MTAIGQAKGRFASAYGASPLHLLAVIASFALASYGFLRISHSPAPVNTIVWFAGAIIAHDLIAFPVYSLLGLIAYGATGPRNRVAPGWRISPLNYLRVPTVLSAIAFLVWFPLILGLSEHRYMGATGLSTGPFGSPLAAAHRGAVRDLGDPLRIAPAPVAAAPEDGPRLACSA